jgi:hypothetical protein
VRSLAACALILTPFMFAPGHATNFVANVAQSGTGVIAVKSSRYARKDCSPVNGPFGFYGNIFCRPNEQEYLRNLSGNWPQQSPRRPYYKYDKPKR